ncbi:MAG: two-component regulator propeller domain-containing protein [Breznakibacter sp.]
MKLFVNQFFLLFLLGIFGTNAQERALFDHLTTDDGLSNNTINCIGQDSLGNMWFGTYDGLNCYNGDGVAVYKHNKLDPERSLPSNNIEKLITDGQGTVWIGLSNNKVARLVSREPAHFTCYDLSAFRKGPYGDFRLSRDGHLVVDFADMSVIYQADRDAFVHHAGTQREADRTGTFKMLFPDAGIDKVVERRTGEFWMSTRTRGILVAERDLSGAFPTMAIKHNPIDPLSLSNNEVYDLFLDKYGVMWVGTKDGGVNRYIEESAALCHMIHEPNNPRSLPRGTIRAIGEDARGNIWIGTYGDGVAICSDRHEVTARIAHPDSQDDDWDRVRSICRSSDHSMWVGSYKGVYRVYPNGQRKYYSPFGTVGTIPYGRIYAMSEDKEGKLWVCAWDGLMTIDLKSDEVQVPHIEGVAGKHCRALCIASDGKIWIGTEYDGIFLLDPSTGLVDRITQRSDTKNTLCNNGIFSIAEAEGGVFWIGTSDGISRYDSQRRQFKNFSVQDGLLSNLVLGVGIDQRGNVWASTSAGLSCIDPLTLFVGSYNHMQGLVNEELTEGAFFLGREDRLYLGGTQGVDIVDLSKLPNKQALPDLFFEVFGHGAANGVTDRLRIGYFDRADKKLLAKAVCTPMSGRCAIAWRIPSVDSAWHCNWQGKAEIPLGDLGSGHYRIECKAANNQGMWSPVKSLQVQITPPFWQKRLFVVSAVCAVVGFLWLFYHLRLKSVRRYNKTLALRVESRTREITAQKELLDRQNQMLVASNNDILKQKDQILAQRDHLAELHQKLKEETESRLQFYAGISHEFRTPLSLIRGHMERIAAASPDSLKDMAKTLETVKEQTDFLIGLVDQTIDYKKLQSGQMSVDRQYGELESFCRDVVGLFAEEAARLGVDLQLKMDTDDGTWLLLDFEKIRIILNNLISNAIKFTPANGEITVRIGYLQPVLTLEVTDTGIGIPDDCLDLIFDRYYQIGKAINAFVKGSGIGLALVKEVVALHNGHINVKSHPDQGSSFFVTLPVEEPCVPIGNAAGTEQEQTALGNNGTVPTILLVEDHGKMRDYLRELLVRNGYHVVAAAHGAEALHLLKSLRVDLILSDWMMPVMDGMGMCRKVKSSPQTKHIPFVLVTAKNSHVDQEQALDAGVTDFVAKPFSEKMLLGKLGSLIARDQDLRDAYKLQQQLAPADVAEPTADDRLVGKLVQTIHDHMDDPDLSPDKLCELLGMSKMKLYRKSKQLTGFAPIELIRSIRIKRAAQLLLNKGFTISEVGFKVGFNDPKYFSRCFQKEFHMTPSQFQEQNSVLA